MSGGSDAQGIGQLLPQEGHISIFGQTGLGKTTLARALVRRISPQTSPSGPGRRVLVADPFKHYGQVAVAVSSLGELSEYLSGAQGAWKVAYQGAPIEEAFPALCNIVADLGRVFFVVEEADWYCSPQSIVPEFAHLIKYGRNSEVTVCGISRQPSEVHRLLTSQSFMVYSFAITEPIYLKYMREFVSDVFAEGLPDLPRFVCKVYDRSTRNVRTLRVDQAGHLSLLTDSPLPV